MTWRSLNYYFINSSHIIHVDYYILYCYLVADIAARTYIGVELCLLLERYSRVNSRNQFALRRTCTSTSSLSLVKHVVVSLTLLDLSLYIYIYIFMPCTLSRTLHARIHAFISSRLDHCNSLLSDVGDGALRKLLSVQNAAARLITTTRKFDHISHPAFRDLN